MSVVNISKIKQMETGGFGESLEERIFFTGPASTVDSVRRVRLEARKAAAALMRTAGARGTESEAHCERTAVWSRRLAQDLGLSSDRVLDVELGALLHDVGYAMVRDVDFHRPGPLPADDKIDLRRHCDLGAAILRDIPVLRRAVQLVQFHHEEFDGSGYPFGLAGLDIPIDARIFHLVDAYESLTHDRPHRARVSDSKARDILEDAVGRSFDPLVHAAFARIEPSAWKSLVGSFL